MIGKFSIRIVPDQTPEGVEKTVVEYCNKVFLSKSGSILSHNCRLTSIVVGWRFGESEGHQTRWLLPCFMGEGDNLVILFSAFDILNSSVFNALCYSKLPVVRCLILTAFRQVSFEKWQTELKIIRCWVSDPDHPNYEAGIKWDHFLPAQEDYDDADHTTVINGQWWILKDMMLSCWL